MNYTLALRQALLFSILFFLSARVSSQDCIVEKDSLKGSYSGDCKNGKANGKGKAIGTDTYEGDFKSGLPDGDGVYTWKNGNSYTGKFSKGSMDGKGNFSYKRANGPDSIITGFWKKDRYIGKYEKPYVVYYKSKAVTDVDVSVKKGDVFKQITFFVTNTSGGTSATDGIMTRMIVDNVQLTGGAYGRIMRNADHAKKTETILYDVVYPTRMRVNMGSEQIEIEFNEEGSYIVDIRINL